MSSLEQNDPSLADQGLLFVVAAPSGAGKTSLVNALLDAEPSLALSISHTTRDIRPGETQGREYHFTERSVFEEMIAQGLFLEHADVFGNLYGTNRQSLSEQRAAGHDVILEIDWQGAAQVRQAFPDALSIFILPPSRRELLKRLTSRGQDSADVIARRTAQATTEIAQHDDFDYLIINDNFDTASADLLAIVRAARCRRDVVTRRHPALISDLLNSGPQGDVLP